MGEVARTYRGVTAAERGQRRRAQLLEACLDLVGSGGTLAVTAEAISAQAKLTKRYFYESFDDRDAILVAALDEMFADLTAAIRQAIAASGPDDQIQAIATAFVAALHGDRRRARLYAESSAIHALQARREQAIGTFTDLLVDEVAPKPVDVAKRRLMTRIVVAGVTDVVMSWINGTIAGDQETLTAAIVTLGRTIQ